MGSVRTPCCLLIARITGISILDGTAPTSMTQPVNVSQRVKRGGLKQPSNHAHESELRIYVHEIKETLSSVYFLSNPPVYCCIA